MLIAIMTLAGLAFLAAIIWCAFEAGVPELMWEFWARVRVWRLRRQERKAFERWVKEEFGQL